MKLTKVLFTLLALVCVLVLLPATISAAEEDCIYLSISFDGEYIDDQYGEPVVYMPVPMEAIEAVDLTEYGLENMLYDSDGDGEYETTALQLMIYAHENIYGGDWSEVNFDAMPGSSYFAGGIFGFTENLVYFHNGDFPVDEGQHSDFMTIGATSDRIVLRAGDFLDVASFSCYSFLWDTLGGFHFFADDNGYTHAYEVTAGEELNVHLLHSFCDLMYGEGWCVDAIDFEVYYGEVYGEALGSITTDDCGLAQILFENPGTYYVWCKGGNGDDYTHFSCDYFFATGDPCIVSAPAFSKVIVTGAETPEPEKFDVAYARMILGNALEFQFAVPQATAQWDGAYAVIEKQWADGTTTEKTLYAAQWDTVTISGEKYWAIVYDGLAAKEMGDQFRVTIYNAAGEAISNAWTDSVQAYVLRSLDGQKAAGKTMMVDMLNYGAAAQVQFGYDQENPANNCLSAQQQAYGTAEAPAMVNNVVKGQNYSASRFILQSRIQTQVGFNGLKDTMYAIYSFTDHNGKQKTIRVEGTDFIDASGKKIGVELSALVYADARTMVDVTIYNADGTVYGSASDSIESCCARSTKGDDVFVALMKFADSAKIYLH